MVLMRSERRSLYALPFNQILPRKLQSNLKARGIDAKNYVNDRYLKRLEEEGFVKKVWRK
jgi:hypothetical protein